MAREYKTQAGGTYTSEGWIPNKRHPMFGVMMPVKLRLNPEKVPSDFPVPDRSQGCLAFVLPSGGPYLDH